MHAGLLGTPFKDENTTVSIHEQLKEILSRITDGLSAQNIPHIGAKPPCPKPLPEMEKHAYDDFDTPTLVRRCQVDRLATLDSS